MSRRRRDDDSGEYDRPRPRKNSNAVLWIVLAVVGMVVLVCGGGAVVVLRSVKKGVDAATIARKDRQVAEDARESDPTTKTWRRDEFRDAVMGKTQAEVLEAVGTPNSTQEGFVIRWYYRNRTLDTVTGKKDWQVQVNFGRNGLVESVNF